MITWIDTTVEMAECQILDRQRRLIRLRRRPMQFIGITELPGSRGLRQIVRRVERPLVLLDLIKTLVVEHCHQRSISRCTVRILDSQFPFLLLTRCQTVTEGFPCQSQFFVRHRTSDSLLVFVTYTVLNPRIGYEQTISIFLLIHKLPIEKFCILPHRTLLYDLVAGIDTIDHIKIRIAGTDLQSDGLSIVGELAVRNIEPVVCLCGRLCIVQAKDHKGHINRVAFADGH